MNIVEFDAILFFYTEKAQMVVMEVKDLKIH